MFRRTPLIEGENGKKRSILRLHSLPNYSRPTRYFGGAMPSKWNCKRVTVEARRPLADDESPEENGDTGEEVSYDRTD